MIQFFEGRERERKEGEAVCKYFNKSIIIIIDHDFTLEIPIKCFFLSISRLFEASFSKHENCFSIIFG